MTASGARLHWRNLPLRLKFLVILGIPLVPLMLTGTLLYVGQRSAADAERAVQEALVRKAELDRLQTRLVEAEVAARGAVLTRSSDNYDLYGMASAGVLEGMETLSGMITDPAQRARFDRMVPLVRARPLAHIVDYARQTPRTAPPPLALLAQSRAAMSALRQVIGEMHAAEDQVLAARTDRARNVRRRALWVTLGCLSLGLIGGVVAAAAFTRSVAHDLALVGVNARRLAEGEALLAMPDQRDEVGALAASLADAAALLERRNAEIRRRIEEISDANRELEAFSYSVSHDLRAPLRHIAGFATLLERRAGDHLDEVSRRYVQTIVGAAARMGRLVDDLLSFSRMARVELVRQVVSLYDLAAEVIEEVEGHYPDVRVQWTVNTLPVVMGDRSMLRLVLVNLLSNAVKYSATREVAEVEVGAYRRESEHVVFVRDNGVGFDMTYVDKLFGVFQRLHGSDEFEGTGIGLANVRRIVQRHGGRTWAEGSPDHGATFSFSLPVDERIDTA